MAEVRVIMPKLGMTMTKGTVLEWKKKEGDKVEREEPIVTVESEKITSDISAPAAGILKNILHGEGDEVPVGEVIGIIDSGE